MGLKINKTTTSQYWLRLKGAKMLRRILSLIVITAVLLNATSSTLFADAVSKDTLRSQACAITPIAAHIQDSFVGDKVAAAGKTKQQKFEEYFKKFYKQEHLLYALGSAKTKADGAWNDGSEQYFIAMYTKWCAQQARKAAGIILPEDNPLIYPEGLFWPSSFLSGEERQTSLAATKYESISITEEEKESGLITMTDAELKEYFTSMAENFDSPLEFEKYQERIKRAREYTRIAREEITERKCILEGGQGRKLLRELYDKNLHGKDKLGAKGTDLVYFIHIKTKEVYRFSIEELVSEAAKERLSAEGRYPTIDDVADELKSDIYDEKHNPEGNLLMASIAEVKMLQEIKEAEKGSRKAVILEPIVSIGEEPSKDSYEELLQKPYLFDVIDIAHGDREGRARTYGQMLEDNNLKLRWHITARFPYIDTAKADKIPGAACKDDVFYTTPTEGNASGSHGEWGYKFLLEIFHEPSPRNPVIRSFYNGDNTNAKPDEFMLGWMYAERIPIAMLGTPRTLNDSKGGIIGEVRLPGDGS